jgi:hypothetical protein
MAIVLVIRSNVRGFKAGLGRCIFKGDKNTEPDFLRRGSAVVGRMSLRFYDILKNPVQ